MTIAIYTHKDCLEHDTGIDHPECTERLRAILDALKKCSFTDALRFIDAPPGSDEQILLAHTEDYLTYIKDARPSADHIYLDADTVMSDGSWNAALRAVGVACIAVDDVMNGKYNNAFCAVRPPGHHAERNRAMGFTLLTLREQLT